MTDLGRWFWMIVVGSCILWYCTITVIVAVRGLVDIRDMLARIHQGTMDSDQ